MPATRLDFLVTRVNYIQKHAVAEKGTFSGNFGNNFSLLLICEKGRSGCASSSGVGSDRVEQAN